MRSLNKHLLVFLSLLLLLGAGCDQARRARHLSRADKFYAADKYASAEIEYLRVLRTDGENTHALSRLGIIYFDQGRLPHAFFFLTNASAKLPEDLGLRAKISAIYLAAGKGREARAEADFILGRQPTNAEAPLLLVQSATDKKQLEETRQRLGQLAKRLGETSPVQLAYGALELREGNTNASFAALQGAVALDPKSSAAHYALGMLSWARNDLAAADAELKKAAELDSFRSPRRLKYAEFKIQTGQAAEGKSLLAEITKAAPDCIPAWVRQAELALAERRNDEADSLLRQALAQDSANFDALLLRGRVLLARRDGPKAVAQFLQLAGLYERSPLVQYHLALAHLLNEDVGKALNALNQAVTLDPNYADAVLLQAQINLRRGGAGAAVAALEQFLKKHPQVPPAHLLLADAYLAQKRPEDALAVYQRMGSLFPKSPQVPLLAGLTLAQLGRPAEARKALEHSLEVFPDFLPAVEGLVNLDLAANQFAPALERVNAILKKQPAALPYLLLAKIHFAQAADAVSRENAKQPNRPAPLTLAQVSAAQPFVDQTEAALLKSIEQDPAQRPAYLLLAQLYVSDGKQKLALERLEPMAKTNDLAALMQVGMIHDQLKDYPAARAAYEQLLRVNPNSSPALNNLAYLYSERLNDLDKALSMAERARQLQPTDPFAADTLGWILYKRGEYLRALGLINECVARLPNEPEVQFHLGMTHYMLGEDVPAGLALRRALEGDKDFPGKDQIKASLAILAIDPKTASADTRGLLEKRLRDQPKDQLAASRLADIYERDGARDKARDIYEAALKQDPQNFGAMLRLARFYAAKPEDRARAVDLAKRAHNLVPEDPDGSHVLGWLVYQQGDFNWAASLFQEAARKLPEDAGILYDLAWGQYQVGRVAEAESTMQNAAARLATAPARLAVTAAPAADAKDFLAMLAAAKTPAQARAAAPQAQKILAAYPGHTPALMVSALALEQSADYAGAGKVYEKILAANSRFTPATRALALLSFQRLGNDTRAYELALKARDAFRTDPELARALGILNYRRADYPRAVQFLKECAQAQAEDPEVVYHLGMAQFQTKDRAGAKANLQRALTLKLSPDQADQAKKTLTQLK